ncbi:hypothetical protein ANO14919_030350 [Xylariales sp. No.14919]|nr:hypothetical protein ANO14919_030350 [Xylariales sp. No.14919]
MRLLDVRKKKLIDFSTQQVPKYAILSHCWRYGLDEILYEDVEYSELEVWQSKKKGAAEKVIKACAEAEKLECDYIWIDTCCIDKRSSAELSEAINSMFSWYRQAGKCLAFLDDINGLDDLGSSRWFTRGWTLQELIAPDNVRFYNKDWSFVCDRFSMFEKLSDITGVDEMVLRHGHEPELSNWDDHVHELEIHEYQCTCGIRGYDSDKLRGVLDTFSVATIMSWAAGRTTSREEDTAYCLLGLFDINMPLLYGEKGKAFRRLQEEIIARTNDQSILTWMSQDPGLGDFWRAHDLANDPSFFHPFNIRKQWSLRDPAYDNASTPHITVTKEGLEVDVLLVPMVGWVDFFTGEKDSYLAILDCTVGNDPLVRLALAIGKPPWSTNMFDRPTPNSLIKVTPDGPISADGSVSKCTAELIEPERPPDKNPHWQEKIDLNNGEVRRIILTRYLLRRGPHSRNRYQLPPIRIGKVVDWDGGEYDVDYAMPGFDKEARVAWGCDEVYGLMLLTKQESQKFFVLWGPTTATDGGSVDDLWCKVLPVDKELSGIFATAKEWSRYRRSERNSINTEETIMFRPMLRRMEEMGVSHTDRVVLDFGGVSREFLAELKLARFLGRAFFELSITVRLLRSPQACSVSEPYFVDLA